MAFINNTVDPPQYRRSNGDHGKRRYWKATVMESYITKKKHIGDLKISSGIGGVNKGAVLGGRLYIVCSNTFKPYGYETVLNT